MKRKICLISSAHLSYNPRLLKEADALNAAGYDVRVVSMNVESSKAGLDEELMRSRAWRLRTVNARKDSLAGRVRWLISTVQQRRFQKQWRAGASASVTDQAFSRYLPLLASAAAQEPAALFIAHNLPALPAAARAAARHGAKLGFDAEDFHRGEIMEAEQNSTTARLARAVEDNYLPRCAHLTAASDGIGAAYVRVTGVRTPVTVLNTFPLSERQDRTPPADLARERQLQGLSLYWYSQVIGADRGLGDALTAISLAKPGVVLHLRGQWDSRYESDFWQQVEALGVRKQVCILPPVPPEQLVERAAQHDVGLALELGHTENRRVAVTNKLLNYFLAELAIAASDVPGQRAIMESAPGAGFLYRPGDAEQLVRKLNEFVDSPESLARTKSVSGQHGRERFCWEVESKKLVGAVGRSLGEADAEKEADGGSR